MATETRATQTRATKTGATKTTGTEAATEAEAEAEAATTAAATTTATENKTADRAATEPVTRGGSFEVAPAEGVPAGVDESEAELASRVRMVVMRLHRRLRQHNVGGLTPSQTSALASISRLGAPTLGELALTESVQPPSMTRIVANLEEAGYVKRVVDQADRRVARVTLLASGRKVLQQNRSLKNAFLARQIRQLDDGEQVALAELTVLLEHLLKLAEDEHAGEP
jgi:DNA-binding MarR family transcriptional regulator